MSVDNKTFIITKFSYLMISFYTTTTTTNIDIKSSVQIYKKMIRF